MFATRQDVKVKHLIAWLEANGLFAAGALFERVVVAAGWVCRIECTLVPFKMWEHAPDLVVSLKSNPKGAMVYETHR